MNGYPVLIRSEGSIPQTLAIGSTGIVCQHRDHLNQVIKAPIKHRLDGCRTDVVETTLDSEDFARLCFKREKTIYGILPKHLNILDYIKITEDSILRRPT